MMPVPCSGPLPQQLDGDLTEAGRPVLRAVFAITTARHDLRVASLRAR